MREEYDWEAEADVCGYEWWEWKALPQEEREAILEELAFRNDMYSMLRREL